MEIRSDTAHLILNRAADYSTAFLRTALGISFLSGVADRFGLWGTYGQPNVAWGDFSRFIEYTGKLNWFAPFAALDNPASSERTRTVLSWKPKEPGLISDLEHGRYFDA